MWNSSKLLISGNVLEIFLYERDIYKEIEDAKERKRMVKKDVSTKVDHKRNVSRSFEEAYELKQRSLNSTALRLRRLINSNVGAYMSSNGMRFKPVFVTLTFSPEALVEQCELTEGGYSLSVKHMQDFMKRLRRRFDDRVIRVFYAGEYGEPVEANGFIARPHYHLCLFNFDFPDKVFWQRRNGVDLYRSGILEELWPFGFSTVGGVTFESAAYVARYVMKKISGKNAAGHYAGRLPEYVTMSRRPGIGRGWVDKFMSDIYPADFVVVRGRHKVKPPRYYDKVFELSHAEQLSDLKLLRRARQRDNPNNSRDRLAVRRRVTERRCAQLKRGYENASV